MGTDLKIDLEKIVGWTSKLEMPLRLEVKNLPDPNSGWWSLESAELPRPVPLGLRSALEKKKEVLNRLRSVEGSSPREETV